MRQDPRIIDAVVDFFQELFGAIFTAPFAEDLKADRLRRGAVTREVEAVADASSQAITRFFQNEQLELEQVQHILSGWASLRERIVLADVSNASVTPESLAERLGPGCPAAVTNARQEAVYRLALHSVLQVLMLVGPVMAEWRRLRFPATFALVQQVRQRLDQIAAQLAVGRSGQETVDERYELSYRDHLLLRFNQVEAGTVRMTTNMAVDLRELFVMPRVRVRAKRDEGAGADGDGLMRLAEAREVFGSTSKGPGRQEGRPALEEIRQSDRTVLVGAPGSGKSSFLEWLQLRLAGVEDEMVLGDQQAIPLLLRVRQLDPEALPTASALIEKATASKELATLMPAGWLDRQMERGRVLVMLDGLDETDPELRITRVLPWLMALCQKYPRCRYLISSRPVGHPAGTLDALGFVEHELLDFDEAAVREYVQHWCISVRLAQNEPSAEARTEGRKDGDEIVSGFRGHPYVRNLARNPLMLSAICLVHHFENGELPRDRSLLYRLCVEGLLHTWDKRRGIRAEFGLDEKIRVCREIAIAMQALDQAELELPQILQLVAQVLGDPRRAERLIEHVRYRTGLLVERRPRVFAFAHLTFQEYLAAAAVHEGNRVGIDADTLARDHADGRWQEVIALYCGLAPVARARALLNQLMAAPDAVAMPDVLANAFFSSGPALVSVEAFRRKVIRHIAISSAPPRGASTALAGFDPDEVAPIANDAVGSVPGWVTIACDWLVQHRSVVDGERLCERLLAADGSEPVALSELVWVTHSVWVRALSNHAQALARVYRMPGPRFSDNLQYACQGVLAMLALANSGTPTRLEVRHFITVLMSVFSAVADLDGDGLRLWPSWRLRVPVEVLDAWTSHLRTAERHSLGHLAAQLAAKYPDPKVAAQLAERSARLLAAPTPKARKTKKKPPR